MARKRMIDPNIWGDPDFAKLCIKSRVLFIGLISNADDEGYLQGDPGSIKRLIFGFDSISVSATQVLIKELADTLHSVHIYEEHGQTYIHLANWFKYQKQQKDRIIASLFPKCSKCLATDEQVLKEVKLSRLSKEKLSSVGEYEGKVSAEDGGVGKSLLQEKIKNLRLKSSFT